MICWHNQRFGRTFGWTFGRTKFYLLKNEKYSLGGHLDGQKQDLKQHIEIGLELKRYGLEKLRVRDPRSSVPLTPESLFRMTPIKS